MKKCFLFVLSLLLSLGLCINPCFAMEKPAVYSDYIYMYDADTHQVLWDKGSEEIIFPASLTKMMTAIVAIENTTDFDQKLEINEEVLDGLIAAGASRAGFWYGDEVSIMDLLYGVLLPSGAECCQALALHIGGSVEGYVDMMNAKAAELGMVNTHFVNTTGLHNDDHYTTLKDLSVLLDYCLQNPVFYQIFTTQEWRSASWENYPDGLKMEATVNGYLNGSKAYQASIAGFQGSKTGFTYEAEFCLASLVEHEGHRYILITAHAWIDRYTPVHIMDADTIYNYFYNNYSWQDLIAEGHVIKEVKINNSWNTSKLVFISDTALAGIYPNDTTIAVDVHHEIEAPIYKDQQLGALRVMSGDEVIHEQLFVADRDIKYSWTARIVQQFVKGIKEYPLAMISIIGIIIVAIILIVSIIRRRNHVRRKRKRRKVKH